MYARSCMVTSCIGDERMLVPMQQFQCLLPDSIGHRWWLCKILHRESLWNYFLNSSGVHDIWIWQYKITKIWYICRQLDLDECNQKQYAVLYDECVHCFIYQTVYVKREKILTNAANWVVCNTSLYERIWNFHKCLLYPSIIPEHVGHFSNINSYIAFLVILNSICISAGIWFIFTSQITSTLI